MQIFAGALISAGVLATAGLGLAGPASAAGGADDVVNGLKTEGYSVQLSSTPTANLSACTVNSVNKDPAGGSNPTAYVDLSCPTGC